MIAFQLPAQPQKSIHNQRVTRVYTQKCLYANIPYWIKPYHKHNKYLCVQLDTCTDVNLMPKSVYKLVFNDLQTAKLAKNDIDPTVYTRHSVDLIGNCTFYMLSKGTKQPIKVEFYIANEEGSVLLSWETVFHLQLLYVKSRLEYLTPRAMLISSAANHPKREIHAQSTVLQQHNSTSILPTSTSTVPQENIPRRVRIVKSKEHIQEHYPELFIGIGWFPGEPCHIHTNQSITPKQTPCRPIPVHLKQTFRQEIDKMLTTRVIKPVHEATPWINSFILVDSTDKSTGKPKLWICFDPTNLNIVIICEPYCFQTPEDIAHKLAGATVITVLVCSKGYWHQLLDDESSYLMTFNTEIGQFRFTVMPFRATVASDVFQSMMFSNENWIPFSLT